MAKFIECPFCKKTYNSLAFDKCPFCGDTAKEDDSSSTVYSSNDESDDNFWSMLWKFLHFYEELTPAKAYLLLGGELILGIGIVLIGWLMSSNSGYRGNSTGAFGFLIGGILLFYSLYAIIKHTTKLLMTKRTPNVKEIKIRAVALFAEFVVAGLLFLIGNSISANSDAADMMRIIAVGIASVSALSMLKFLIKQLFSRNTTN